VLQLATWQEPELQVALALLRVQLRPHWAQCVLVLSFCSQPSAVVPLQSPNPLLQAAS
jgi:hypothetical protein